MYNAAVRLSIDLSNRVGSMALHKIDGGLPVLVSVQSLDGENRHSELMLTYLDKFLETHKLKTRELTELVTSLGPGSFTGLRIALSTMKAFSVAWKIPLFLANGSEARARAFKIRNPAQNADLLVLTKVASRSYSRAILTSSGDFKEDETIEREGLVFPEGTSVIVDSGETKELLKIESDVFPLEAEFLGEQLEYCKSRVDCITFESLVNASPIYYGSSRF